MYMFTYVYEDYKSTARCIFPHLFLAINLDRYQLSPLSAYLSCPVNHTYLPKFINAFFLQEHTVSKLDQGHDDTVSTVFTDIF